MEIKNTLRFYNTMSREIEDFVPLENGKVKIYACGPTVYDFAHIGHMRKYIMDDVLVRLLRYLAFEVTHVMNITDVGHLISDADSGEDKMEKGARREGKTAWEVAKFYEEHFLKSLEAVNVKRPSIICRATEHIKEQVELIKTLVTRGVTYTIDDGVYFDSTKIADYGKLARLNVAGQKAGARVEQVKGKKHPTDFALWKFTPKGTKRDMEWDSPWGKGFPGWHIECSAMSMKYLGETIDIHTGGIDHIPIHHPNEIAQSESATGKKFVNYWIHHNFVFVDGVKMSKSLNNFYTLDDVVKKGFSPLALRYLFLQTHYRQETNFTWDALQSAETALNQLCSQISVIKMHSEKRERSQLSDENLDKVNQLRKEFKDVIRFDLNSPQAISVIWEIIKTNIPPGDKYDLLMIGDEILGLGLKDVKSEQAQIKDIPKEISSLLAQREDLRRQKKFMEADEVRLQIEKLGYTLKDTSSGTSVKKSS